MPKLSTLAHQLQPYLLPMVEKAIRGVQRTTIINQGSSGGGAVVPGDTTTFLLRDGTRSLTGNLSVDASITIDGVDLSAHAADPDAHHERAVAGDGILVDIVPQEISVNTAFNFAGAASWTGTHQFDVDPQINANLDFIGATDRYITASSHLRLEPEGDLWLSPDSNLIQTANATTLRSQTIGDVPTGISGWHLWDRGGNQSQLTITAIKADELFVRFFTADETRIRRGEMLIGKSYGIVEVEFVVPADEATVDVWFEGIAQLPGDPIFEVGDWILGRTIDRSGGSLTVMAIWFTVVSLQDTDTTADGKDIQQWRLKRESGGLTGETVPATADFLSAGRPTADKPPGQLGDGVIFLTALNPSLGSAGPRISVGYFDSVLSDVPQFKYPVVMGNLRNMVDYTTDAWG
ncbi:MAG: hypothetical protein ACTS5I_07540, partial [Rhodanobacter sp.]